MKPSTAQMTLNLLAPLYLGMAASRNSDGSDDSAIINIREAIAALEVDIEQPVGTASSANRCCFHDSDCAVHNMPAYPAGPCDCSLSTAKPIAWLARSPYDKHYSFDETGAQAICRGYNKGFGEDVCKVIPLYEHPVASTQEAAAPEPVNAELLEVANALLHQIDIGDFVDSHGHSAKMLKPVHDLMRLLAISKSGGAA